MNEISKEQKIHDLAVAYAVYSISQGKTTASPDDLYQEYEEAYEAMKKVISHYE